MFDGFWAVEVAPSPKSQAHEVIVPSLSVLVSVKLAVKPFVEERGVTFPILIGTREVVDDFGGVSAIPTAFILDREGRVVHKFVGYREKAVFEEVVKKLL